MAAVRRRCCWRLDICDGLRSCWLLWADTFHIRKRLHEPREEIFYFSLCVKSDELVCLGLRIYSIGTSSRRLSSLLRNNGISAFRNCCCDARDRVLCLSLPDWDMPYDFQSHSGLFAVWRLCVHVKSVAVDPHCVHLLCVGVSRDAQVFSLENRLICSWRPSALRERMEAGYGRQHTVLHGLRQRSSSSRRSSVQSMHTIGQTAPPCPS
mmetsp:Transcript_7277/g.22301  ORF Transcript_7277/g.22301 Transcript_7277/m.22301 type:complete len:209 (+) Transcript_7277:647-1273(+)